MDIANPVIRYFVEYWKDLWHGVSRRRDLMSAFNPRVVVKELLNEITLNKARNNANQEFFRRSLGTYLKSDPGSQGRVKLHLQRILKEFDTVNHRPAYMEQLCRSGLRQFAALWYLEDTLNAFIREAQALSLDTSRKIVIRTIVNHLIVELREVGYADREIQKIPDKLFATVHRRDNVVSWEYPHSFECRDWEDEAVIEEYERTLRQHEASLTDIDRLRTLLQLAKTDKKRFTYIFRVLGISGSEEIQVGAVLLYAPAKRVLMSRDDPAFGRGDSELFGSRDPESPINAAVTIQTVSVEAGEASARETVEKALSASRQIMQIEAPVRLSRSYIALRDEGTLAARRRYTFERLEDDWTKHFTLDIEQKRHATRRLALLEKTQAVAQRHGWEQKFDQACYWLRRADESTSDVEKLLSYWICIECLCSKSDESGFNWFQTKRNEEETDIYRVREIVGKLRAVAKCFERGWDVYNEIAEPMAIALLELPPDIVEAARLAPAEGDQIHLADFINNTGRIAARLPEGLLKDQVSDLQTFYSDKVVALRVLREQRRIAQDELAYIYRMRNKIAHDGSGDDPMLSFLSTLAGSYALTLFHRIIYYVTEKGATSLPALLIAGVQEYEFIAKRLEIESPMKVFLDGQI